MEPIFYVDTSVIREGKLADVESQMHGLASFVDENVPQLISYNFFIDESQSKMTVVAIHPDTTSLEFHLTIGGPRFREFSSLIELHAIDVYGRPSETVRRLLAEKAQMLGTGTVTVHSLVAGFNRLNIPSS